VISTRSGGSEVGFDRLLIATGVRARPWPNATEAAAERGPAPLAGALGRVVGAIAAGLQRDHGVDLRCGVTVTALEGDPGGRLRRAHLSDGTVLDADVAIVALGSVRRISPTGGDPYRRRSPISPHSCTRPRWW
jgi:NADPH-dependent 2,4-dienoyl-CoA reductase/sulfur reductase-like enzyme